MSKLAELLIVPAWDDFGEITVRKLEDESGEESEQKPESDEPEEVA